MNADKEKYLKQENKQLELSKLDGIEDYNANYMAGYRHGYERAYIDVLSKIDSISRAIEVIDIQKELSLIENDTINNEEEMNFYFKAYDKSYNETEEKDTNTFNKTIKAYQDVLKSSDETKERIKKLETSFIKQGYKNDFIYLPYLLDIDDTGISVKEIINIINKQKPTSEYIGLLIKDEKATYGQYAELGEKEEEKLSYKICSEVCKYKDDFESLLQDELIKIYKSRLKSPKMK